jgi:hypothetical protein
MIKNKTSLEIKKGERIYQFICELDSPLGEVFDVMSEIRGYAIDLMNKANQPPPSQEQPPVNEVPDGNKQ